jgi:hypothetical protein
LEKLAEEKVPLFIWGMSQYAQLLLGNPLVKRCSIKALIDSDERKQQRTIGGRTIHSPEILRHAHKENAVLLTGLSYHKQMKEYLKKISFQGVVVELD